MKWHTQSIWNMKTVCDLTNDCKCCFYNSACCTMGGSGGVVSSLDFCLASLKSLGCFYFRCILSSQWKAVTVNLQILHCTCIHACFFVCMCTHAFYIARVYMHVFLCVCVHMHASACICMCVCVLHVFVLLSSSFTCVISWIWKKTFFFWGMSEQLLVKLTKLIEQL